jgi:hypothetical protein
MSIAQCTTHAVGLQKEQRSVPFSTSLFTAGQPILADWPCSYESLEDRHFATPR